MSIEMILALVPESEHLDYNEALALAEERDEQEAKELKRSVRETFEAEMRIRFPLWA